MDLSVMLPFFLEYITKFVEYRKSDPLYLNNRMLLNMLYAAK